MTSKTLLLAFLSLSLASSLQVEEFVEVKEGEPVTLKCNFEGEAFVIV